MSKITLEVHDKNIDTVMNILNNLKEGLITNISNDNKTHQKPLPTSNSKYLSKDAYKQKLRKNLN